MAYRYASNPSEAEDIAQDALLRAWRRRSTLRDGGRRNQWLATIVRNEAFRQRARPRPDPTAEIEALEGVEDERVLATVELADLHAALKRLGRRERQLLAMRYQLDLTQAEIAAPARHPGGDREGAAAPRPRPPAPGLRGAVGGAAAGRRAGLPVPVRLSAGAPCTRGRAGRGEVRTAG